LPEQSVYISVRINDDDADDDDDLCSESTSLLGEGNVFPMLLVNDRVSMVYAVFTTPRWVNLLYAV